VSPAGFYAWLDRPDSLAEQRRQELVAAMAEIHAEVRHGYGRPRMTAELNHRGFDGSENFVATLMRAHGIRGRTAKRLVRTTDSRHDLPVAANVLDRDFTPSGPNVAWAADITYLPTAEGWLSLAVVEDLYSRRVVGGSMDATMTSRLVVDAPHLASGRRHPQAGLLKHSDRGSQYARQHDQGVLAKESSRFQKLAAIPDTVFDHHLTTRDARREITTTGVLKLLVTAIRPEATPTAATTDGVTDLYQLVRNGRTFGTIYADPPWEYGNQATRGAAARHYRTMTIEQIAALPVPKLAAPDAHLHLWTTNAFLFAAEQVIRAWGFEYKSCFVWTKPTVGLGNSWRVAHEFLLLGVQGKCPFRNKGQRSWQCIERGEQSAKPEPIRQLIEMVSPGPYLEMFGRRNVQGWTVWGDELIS
jgi:transposase InsO family protein/N6-adenosine-specific RNA methylase IME4